MRHVILLILLTGVTALSFTRAADLRFIKSAELSDAGLNLKVMAGADSDPLPSPEVFYYRMTDGVSTTRMTCYRPDDLWRQSQCLGRWSDADGARVTLAGVTQPPPGPFPREHVSREEYDSRQQAAAPSAWTADALTAWAARFAGASAASATSLTPGPSSKVRPLVSLQLTGAPATRAAYLFRLNPGVAGQASAATNWYAAVFDFPPHTDMAAIRSAVESGFFSAIEYRAPLRTAARPSGPPGRRPGVQTATTADTPERAASRNQAADSIRNLKDWWSLDTPNYIILSDLKSGAAVLVRELQEHLEPLRGFFVQCMPPRAPIQAVSVLRIFADDQEFRRFIGPDLPLASGVWMPSKSELVLRRGEGGTTQEQRQLMQLAAYHEAFHQYLHYAFDHIEFSTWFNEGHATMFEALESNSGKHSIGENDHRLPRLLDLIARNKADPVGLMRMSREEFYINDQTLLAENYALAWGVIYYLRRGAPLESPPRHAKLLDTYTDTLWSTRDAQQANNALLAALDADAFRQDFQKFWKSSSRRAAAKKHGFSTTK